MEKINLIYVTIVLCVNLQIVQIISATSQLSPTTGEITGLPKNCSNYKWQPEHQPKRDPNAFIRKCCPPGFAYNTVTETECVKTNVTMHQPPVIEARFYITEQVDCIEDLESGFKLEMKSIPKKLLCPPNEENGKPTAALRYEFKGDEETFYLLQNGSLILVDAGYAFYEVFTDYCVEMEGDKLVAFACSATDDLSTIALTKLQVTITAYCMFISVPCLFVTAFIYLLIPKLRNVHGETLAAHSICLGVGFLLMAWIHIADSKTAVSINYIIQFLILSCFCWLLAMTIDITVNVWYFLPRSMCIKKFNMWRLLVYSLFALGLPAIIVLVGPSQPSYYSMAQLEGQRNDSLKYFIIPICVILVANAVLFIGIYKGFREIHAISSLAYLVRWAQTSKQEDHSSIVSPCTQTVEEVKRYAKSAVWLFVIMTVNWIFEIITFFHENLKVAIMVFEVLNALQGVVIFIIFVLTPYYKNIIIDWWFDRGSMECPRDQSTNGAEMTLLNGRNNHNHDAVEKQ